MCIAFRKAFIGELCYHKKVGNQQKDQKMREFVQVERSSTHDVMVDMVIMGIIEKHTNNQSHYILEMNMVVSILLRAILVSNNSSYNQFINHFNNVTIEVVFLGWFNYVSTLFIYYYYYYYYYYLYMVMKEFVMYMLKTIFFEWWFEILSQCFSFII